MLRLAIHNLFQNKARLVISVGGVALALTLILALDAIVAGMEGQLTAYIDNSGADIFVSQSGVRNLHMAASAIPLSIRSQVKAVPGVASVTPILYLTNMVVAGEHRHLVNLIGLPRDATMGRPWRITAGGAIPARKEAIIDRSVAAAAGVRLGDTVEILGEDFTVAGLSEGTANLINAIAFISRADFARLRGAAETTSFLLVKVKPGESPELVANRIAGYVDDVTVQTRRAFATQERKIISDMSTNILTIMNLVGMVIGLAVMALTVYTATLARRQEYGVLKALGARNEQLYRVVLAQALWSVALGVALALAITLLLSVVVPRLGINLALEIREMSLLKVASVSLVIAGLSAMLPIGQIAGLDPALVFRGGAK